jgi:hypothetical protein
VVVITVESAARLRGCLEALRTQDAPADEVLIPWDGTHGEAGPLERDYPEMRFVRVNPRGLTYAQLRALGVAESCGEIIALTEDHFIPAPDWCRQIVEAHRAPHAAIGGAVEKLTPDKALNWSFYFADYLRYLDPVEGPSAGLTDGNVTYKRSELAHIAGVWKHEFHENLVHAALARRGQSLWISPRIVVRQKRNLSLGEAVRDRYAFGRLFGSTRIEGMPVAGRWKLALLSPLLPAVLVMRIVVGVLRKRKYVGPLVRALPGLALIATVWAWGEFAGYVTARREERLTARVQ